MVIKKKLKKKRNKKINTKFIRFILDIFLGAAILSFALIGVLYSIGKLNGLLC